jgi:CheY-like chemotaxis protein
MAKILIVDDEEMDRVLLSQVLQSGGHEPLFAPNASVALRIWARNPADLVVTDIVMPEVNGIQLIEALREEDPWIRIIAISGADPSILELAGESGARATLTKPVDPRKLLEEIDKALEDFSEMGEVLED